MIRGPVLAQHDQLAAPRLFRYVPMTHEAKLIVLTCDVPNPITVFSSPNAFCIFFEGIRLQDQMYHPLCPLKLQVW